MGRVRGSGSEKSNSGKNDRRNTEQRKTDQAANKLPDKYRTCCRTSKAVKTILLIRTNSMHMTRHEAEKRLKQTFGFDGFYDDQWAVIEKIVA